MLYKFIGKRIRAHRMEKKMTQEKLAEAADISLSFLGHIERGTRKMSVDTLYKLCLALNCSSDSLMGTGAACPGFSAEDHIRQALMLMDARKQKHE